MVEGKKNSSVHGGWGGVGCCGGGRVAELTKVTWEKAVPGMERPVVPPRGEEGKQYVTWVRGVTAAEYICNISSLILSAFFPPLNRHSMHLLSIVWMYVCVTNHVQ